MRVQRSTGDNSVIAGGTVVEYPTGIKAAILFIRSGDEESLTGLAHVYRAHNALMVNLAAWVPRYTWTSGQCTIRDGGITVTFNAVDPSPDNGGRGMLGAELTVPWTGVDPEWVQAALEPGHLWTGLASEAAYQRACSGGAVDLSKLPPMPVLKLDARRA